MRAPSTIWRSARCWPSRASHDVMPSTIQTDFDRIALLPDNDWDHNSHYHSFLLRQLPSHCGYTLDIGCGTGLFTRLLAGRSDEVLVLDLSPQMIHVARERSKGIHQHQLSNRRRDDVAISGGAVRRHRFHCDVAPPGDGRNVGQDERCAESQRDTRYPRPVRARRGVRCAHQRPGNGRQQRIATTQDGTIKKASSARSLGRTRSP